MKSVSFLRNTFKKWEQKSSTDDKPKGRHSTNLSRTTSHNQPLSARSLNITVKQLPLLPPEPLTAATIDGSWGTPYPTYGPSSTQGHVRNCSLTTGDFPSFAKDTTYRKFSVSSTDVPSLLSNGRSGRAQKSHLGTVERRDSTTRSNGPSWPALTRKLTTKLSSSTSSTRTTKHSPSRPASPQSPSLPSFPLLPPIDLGHTHVKFDSFSSIRKQPCQCSSSHLSDCPRYIHFETQREVVPSSKSGDSDGLQSSPKTVHAVLDLSVETRPRRLYHNSGSSTPHLPYDGLGSPPPRRLGTASSVDSEAGNFPLSLFPAPPPLIVRKKIPAPLVLRPSPPPRSSQSSRDSTPLGTPTTPRFQQVCSLSQSGIASPSKKVFGRPTASITPPKYSPPNSPLPDIPTFHPGNERQRTASAQSIRPPRPLRSFSNNNLRDTVTSFSVNQRHRLTSSEPISDQASLPIKRTTPPKPRPAPLRLQTQDVKSHVDISNNNDQVVTPSGTVESVQWGYAF
ncbi:hypothetical protein CVT24_004927 [Panaeolus cyanescens]|uniref:Uncharacterized protein n=1 Tax=Panaeolus cyanescens TaxID=181874 RepID=A0A409VEF4_9AGAR|nr:hypothetical protein CVT24_004927 [Panaeolus cyanescens]